MIKWIVIVLSCLAALPSAEAQPFDFPGTAVEDPAALAKVTPGLAREVMAVYQEADRRQFLDNRFRLKIVAGQYGAANEDLALLHELEKSDASPQAGATNVL